MHRFSPCLPLLTLALAVTPAHADERPADDTRPTTPASAPNQLARLNMGVRGLIWSSHSAASPSGGFGFGLDGSYLLNPYLGLGGQVFTYSDLLMPEYHQLDLAQGITSLGFAEGRYPVLSWLAPYARAGAGVSVLTLSSDAPPRQTMIRDAPALSSELGLELHYRVSLRAFASALWHPTVTEAAAVYGYGLQLGGRF